MKETSESKKGGYEKHLKGENQEHAPIPEVNSSLFRCDVFFLLERESLRNPVIK